MNTTKSLIFILILFFSNIYSQPFDFTYPINISNMGTDYSSEPSIFIDNNETIHLAFQHNLRTENTKSLFYCFKDKNGMWSEPLQLTDSCEIYSPKIVTDDSNNIFITYQKLYLGEYFKTFVIIRKNNVWQEPYQISEDSLGLGFNPTIVKDSANKIYIFYSNFTGIYWRKYEKNFWRDVDSIITFPPALTALTRPLAIADKNNYIHLVFRYYDENLHTNILYYMKYDGNSWTEKYPVSTIDSLGGPRDYDFTLGNNNEIHVVYTQKVKLWGSDILLYYTARINDSWTVPDSITSSADGEVFTSKIKINPANNKPLIIANIDTNKTHINENNNFFIYQKNGDWIIEDILQNHPNFVEAFFDFLFDKQSNLHYVFTRTDTLAPALADLYYTKGTVITDVETLGQPKDYSIKLEAYPNPFNPTTTISYSIPKRGLVQLKVYDILGKEIETLVNEEKPSGKYSVKFNGSNLPSGVYFYTIRINNFVQSRKMILLR